jgi:hypothetical protein
MHPAAAADRAALTEASRAFHTDADRWAFRLAERRGSRPSGRRNRHRASRGRRSAWAELSAADALRDEVRELLELLVGQLLPEVLGHHAGREALGDLGVGVDDALADEILRLPLERLVEVAPGRASRVGGRERVTRAAALGVPDPQAGARRLGVGVASPPRSSSSSSSPPQPASASAAAKITTIAQAGVRRGIVSLELGSGSLRVSDRSLRGGVGRRHRATTSTSPSRSSPAGAPCPSSRRSVRGPRTTSPVAG